MNSLPRIPLVFALLAGLLLGAAAPLHAKPYRFDREGRWQLTIPINYVGSKSWEGEGNTGLKLGDDLGWGFGFGYNLNERFLLGAEFSWLSTSYQATLAVDEDGDGIQDGTTTISSVLDVSTIAGVVQFNLVERSQFTPFVRGNLGFTLLDTNIPSGPPQGGCWWDPWWGYICDRWQPTYGRTSFAFGGALGLRAQLADTFFLEGAAAGNWLDMPGSTPFFPGARLTIGWIF